MRLGCCGNMIAPAEDPIGVGIIEALAEKGFDYIELSLRDVTALTAAGFSRLAQRVDRSGIRCEACNNFFPPSLPLTGPEANLVAALDYAGRAFERAARLGARVVVFGSSGARNVPKHFSPETAWKQLTELLCHVGPLAERWGIIVTIEPLNQSESNIINRTAEGLAVLREVEHPHIQLLVDFYHWAMEREDLQGLLSAGPAVRHVHFAQPEGRLFPRSPEARYQEFFGCLRQIQYSGRCSIEGYTTDFATDAPRALRLLRELAATPSGGTA